MNFFKLKVCSHQTEEKLFKTFVYTFQGYPGCPNKTNAYHECQVKEKLSLICQFMPIFNCWWFIECNILKNFQY